MDTLPEPATHITVAQALGKFDKFEQVVQHGTEVGASQFVPIQAERSVVRLNNSDIKLARWRQIARDAARQCGRSRVPIVTQPAESLDLFSHDCELVLRGNSLPNGQIRAFMHTDVESQSVRTLLSGLSERPSEIAIAIGPEGGWSINEVTAALSSGWIAISLGRYVLRTETAALVAISRILQCFED
jgi:16S rRNA (uracil1498-N3)-methyltransferase